MNAVESEFLELLHNSNKKLYVTTSPHIDVDLIRGTLKPYEDMENVFILTAAETVLVNPNTMCEVETGVTIKIKYPGYGKIYPMTPLSSMGFELVNGVQFLFENKEVDIKLPFINYYGDSFLLHEGTELGLLMFDIKIGATIHDGREEKPTI